MSHSYQELFYHLVWSTKNREPMINGEIQPVLFEVLNAKAENLDCRIIALNCVPDHVHILLVIPPKLAVSMAINGLKGFSSHEVKPYRQDFTWQHGYGIFTLRSSDLSVVEEYVKNQEKHHKIGTTVESWEAPVEDVG